MYVKMRSFLKKIITIKKNQPNKVLIEATWTLTRKETPSTSCPTLGPAHNLITVLVHPGELFG